MEKSRFAAEHYDWSRLAAQHYGHGCAYRGHGCACRGQDEGEGAPCLQPHEDASLRALLASLITQTHFAPGFLTPSVRCWPMFRPCSLASSIPLSVLTTRARAPSCARLVSRELLPLLAQTAGLLAARVGMGRGPAPHHHARVVYIDHPARRWFPRTKGAAIGPEHINGGVTWPARSLVLVCRREDAGKVLVHELLHLFDAGPKGQPSTMLNEAYVEAVACYLYAAWRDGCFAYEGRQSQARDGDAVRDMRARIERVAASAASHFGDGPFLEDTNAFAYVVCRAALWRPRFLPRLLALPPDIPASAFADLLEAAMRAFGHHFPESSNTTASSSPSAS